VRARERVCVRASRCVVYISFLLKDKDKFGNDVTFLARPLPVEYLIIDVRPSFPVVVVQVFVYFLLTLRSPQITTTFPKDPQYTFCSTQRFPIENREILGETQVTPPHLNNTYIYIYRCVYIH